MFPRPLMRLWPGRGGGGGEGGVEREKEVVALPEEEGREEKAEVEEQDEEEEEEQGTAAPVTERRENWVLKILRVRSILSAEDRKPGGDGALQEELRSASREESGDRILDGEDRCVGCCDAEGSEGCFVGEDEGDVKIDRDSFTRLLQRVSLAEVRLFGQLSYLGSLSYNVSKIKVRPFDAVTLLCVVDGFGTPFSMVDAGILITFVCWQGNVCSPIERIFHHLWSQNLEKNTCSYPSIVMSWMWGPK